MNRPGLLSLLTLVPALVLGGFACDTRSAQESQPTQSAPPTKAKALGDAAPKPAAATSTHEKAHAKVDAAGSAQAAQLRAAQSSTFMLAHVPNYKAFTQRFKANAAARSQAGVVAHLVSRIEGPGDRIIVHYAAESKEKVSAFLSSETFAALTSKDDVTDATIFWFAENVLIDLPRRPLSKSVSLYKKFSVQDFERFRSELKRALPSLREQNLGIIALHRSTADANTAILHIVGPDEKTLHQLYTSPALTSARKAAGATRWQEPLLAIDDRTL